MKRSGTRIFFTTACAALFGITIYSCAGKIESPAPEIAPPSISQETDGILSPTATCFPEAAVQTASEQIAGNIEKTFPVFKPEGKNASDAAVPLALTETACALLPYTRFTAKTPAPDTVTVKIIETEELNAFSAGNRYIFITRALLALTENKKQQTALLAHELAHISLGHTLSRFDPATDKTAAKSAENCLYLIMEGYRSDDEFDADEEALAILTRAGFSPDGLTELLRAMAPRLTPGNPDMATTHPPIAQRIARISKKTQQLR